MRLLGRSHEICIHPTFRNRLFKMIDSEGKESQIASKRELEISWLQMRWKLIISDSEKLEEIGKVKRTKKTI